LGFGVWGLGFGVWGLGFGVWGLGFGVRVNGQGLGFVFVLPTLQQDIILDTKTELNIEYRPLPPPITPLVRFAFDANDAHV
jgi:hypothetical protein